MIFVLLAVASFLFTALSYLRTAASITPADRGARACALRARALTPATTMAILNRARSSLRFFMLPRSWSSIVVVSAIVNTSMIVARSGLVLASALRAVASVIARASPESCGAYVFVLRTREREARPPRRSLGSRSAAVERLVMEAEEPPEREVKMCDLGLPCGEPSCPWMKKNERTSSNPIDD